MTATTRSRPAPFISLLAAALLCASAAAQDDAYRLAVDDVICVHVLYHPDFSVAEATVRPDGRINVPAAGDVEVVGRTVAEVADAITEALRAELRDPRVSVRLVRRAATPVYVLGAVARPGALEVHEPLTVAEAVALAGGLSRDASPHEGVIIAETGRQQVVDVQGAVRGAGPDAHVRIEPGQTLIVSQQFPVTVVGAVRSPGRYPMAEGDRVSEALASAGGPDETAADAGRLVRADGSSIALDLEALTTTGEPEDNPSLAPGDLIVVPERSRGVTIVGAVRAPGRYEFEQEDRVSHAVALAGGLAEDARSRAAVLVRGDGSTAPVDLETLLQGREAADPRLGDGDMVIVPRRIARVAVLGMVESPGVVELEAEMTLMDAVAVAGGWLQEKSEPERTILWRQRAEGTELTFIDAQGLMRGDEGIANPTLEHGDIVYVPSSSALKRDEAARILLGVSGLLRLVF